MLATKCLTISQVAVKNRRMVTETDNKMQKQAHRQVADLCRSYRTKRPLIAKLRRLHFANYVNPKSPVFIAAIEDLGADVLRQWVPVSKRS